MIHLSTLVVLITAALMTRLGIATAVVMRSGSFMKRKPRTATSSSLTLSKTIWMVSSYSSVYILSYYGQGYADACPQGGLFAAALAPLIIDSKQNLKADPTDRIVYYLEQHSTILNQISQQISFIAPEVSIPSTPPLPFPPFAPSSSNIALNTLWFFALVYGIFGALAATLVQKWIRRCLRTLQRSNNPMTSARFRQYLFEQLNKSWITELASNLLYASLFCFFVGLCIYAWDLNSAVASITTIYSITCVCFYFFFQSAVSSEIPIVEPFILFLYFSGVFTQKKMEELWNSKGQDVRAIRWLIENLEEDAEMETFVLAIPGSFNTGWGAEVWKKVSEVTRDESDNKSSATSTSALNPMIYPHPSDYPSSLSQCSFTRS